MSDCYATFHGDGGYDIEKEHARKIFNIGSKYKIIGGRIDMYHTELIFENIEGKWNSVMFDYDEDLAPLEQLYSL